ncbi:MAG: sulfite exporter TauE/SafE family protein [Candidatus Omnitrophica bacterium]|nr:sulfite exporter TauE/SafE family protein [Candidatus Omnitrophota bacterium]MBU1997752.1 sulfite exporter TauE/SafE family protein [Candidatus Omnitrophota bacterium]MBU4334233.1 sulfite exporter TauE/SafE family protein [Candidatus Omnitrophota bacterium]
MQILYLALGLVAGLFSGFFGIGGGIILIPSLLYFFGMTQHQAQGTTLAIMLPPVFFFAVWKYYSSGHVNVPVAIFASVGLTVGAYLGANMVMGVPDIMLKRIFGCLLILVGIKMVFFR